jgi:hypothetical protein
MITSSGAICDICGHYILPIDPKELVNCFKVKGIEEMLHCDNKCKELLQNINKDWTKQGRLYKAFKEHNEKQI